jgi:hypothetical protein
MRLITMIYIACHGRWQDTPGFIFRMEQRAQVVCPYCDSLSIRPATPSSPLPKSVVR